MSVHVPGAVREAIVRFASRLDRDVTPAQISRISSRPPVSVIVPIHRSADALARCLASIRRATPALTEVLLVDDHSADPEVDRVCRAFAAEWPRTKLLRNRRNVGFVATVNRGMREAARDNDVLLLNSDTEVTAGWLTDLGITAHLDEATASVCAVSNAAGALTFPRAHADAELPDGIGPARAQRVLRMAVERERPLVPSTSGFCMLIKRAALERVGFFDELLFVRGYGEENDWNERALSAGFVHRIDDGRFVAHARGLSFGGAKERLKRTNSRVLQALHPAHVERLRSWEGRDPLRKARDAYGALLRDVLGMGERERAALLDVPLTIEIGRSPSPGAWNVTGCRASITVRSASVDVDLFGIARGRGAELARTLFALYERWGGDRVEVDDEFRGQVSALARALGLPWTS